MTNDFCSKIRKTLRSSIFTDEDLKLIFDKMELHKIHNSLSYHLKQKNILKHKRGVYSLADSKIPFSEFELAAKLYAPSFISFESALSYHGLIPEAVYEMTSACYQKKKKLFKTDFGNFSYLNSPVTPFLLEVEPIGEALIAKPIRALFDTIHKRKIHYLTINDLVLDLRIDLEELEEVIASYRASELIELGKCYGKKSTTSLSQILIRSFK